MKAGVVGNGYGLPIRLMGVCGEECLFAFIGVEHYFLGGAPFGVGCVAGEAGAGAAVVTDERSDFGSNRAVAASAGDTVVVSGVLTGDEEGC